MRLYLMIIGDDGRKNKTRRGNAPKLRHCNEYRDRHGKLRRYFRRPGHPAVALPADCGMGSPEFLEAYLAALAATGGTTEIGVKRSMPGTLSAAIAGYYKSRLFEKLSEGTRRLRRSILEHFREADGEKPIAKLRRQDIVKRLDAATPSTARNHLVTFRGLMQYAVHAGLIKEDPTAGVEAAKPPSKTKDDPDAEDGHLTWTEEWIAQYEAYWPITSKPRLAFALALYTAQRRSDVIRMGKGMVKAGVMTLRQQKTGTLVRIPIDPRLARIFAASQCDDEMVYLLTNRKGSYSGSALGTAFRNWCDKAGLPPAATMHGLRKAWCRRAAEAGLSEAQIMSVSGHQTSREVQRYIKMLNQELLARQAIAAVSAGRGGNS
jgi:integrase